MGISHRDLDDIVSIGEGGYATFPPRVLIVNYNGPDISLPTSIGGYGDIYSYTGGGQFLQYSVQVDNDNVYVAIEIDGTVMAELWLENLNDLASSGDPFLGDVNYNTGNNTVTYKPSHPINFSTSFKVVGRADSVNPNRDVTRYNVHIIED